MKALNKLMNEKNSLAVKEMERIRENGRSNINNKEESIMENKFYCPKCHSIVKNLYFECENCGFDFTEDVVMTLAPISEGTLQQMNEELVKTHLMVLEAETMLKSIPDSKEDLKKQMKDIERIQDEISRIIEA